MKPVGDEAPAARGRRHFSKEALTLGAAPFVGALAGCAGSHPQRGAGGAPPADPSNQLALSLADELQRSGFTAVGASFVLDFASNDEPGTARSNLLHRFDAIDAELQRGKLRRALNIERQRLWKACARW